MPMRIPNHRRIAIGLFSITTLATFAWSSIVAADGAPPAAPGVAAAAPAGATSVATAAPDGAAASDPAASPATTTTATATAEPAVATERYPRAVIARPLTLPQGVAMLGADLTSNNDLGTMGGAPIIGYGITDDFEIQIP